MPVRKSCRPVREPDLGLARVLLVDSHLTTRLTLQTLLRAGGYSVDVAASSSEAVGKLEDGNYDLVLSDFETESPEASRNVLAFARDMDYRPATAFVTSHRKGQGARNPESSDQQVVVETEDLLSKVADLIGFRAARRVQKHLRQSASN